MGNGFFYKGECMIENATIKIYVPVITKNSEGTVTKTWGYKTTPEPLAPIETLRADVQPARLSEADIQAYGLTNRSSDAKKIFFAVAPYVNINNRIFVASDFPGEIGCYYEVKGSNHWAIHGEAIVVPVIGEENWVLNQMGTSHKWDDNYIWSDDTIWSEP
jgi:hypothetical protein